MLFAHFSQGFSSVAPSLAGAINILQACFLLAHSIPGRIYGSPLPEDIQDSHIILLTQVPFTEHTMAIFNFSMPSRLDRNFSPHPILATSALSSLLIFPLPLLTHPATLFHQPSNVLQPAQMSSTPTGFAILRQLDAIIDLILTLSPGLTTQELAEILRGLAQTHNIIGGVLEDRNLATEGVTPVCESQISLPARYPLTPFREQTTINTMPSSPPPEGNSNVDLTADATMLRVGRLVVALVLLSAVLTVTVGRLTFPSVDGSLTRRLAA